MQYDVVNTGPDLGQAETWDSVKLVNGIPLDNWIAQSKDYFLLVKWDSDVRYSMVGLNLQQLMQSVAITTKALS